MHHGIIIAAFVLALVMAAPAAENCPPYPGCTSLLPPIELTIAPGLLLFYPQDCACGWQGAGSPLRITTDTINTRLCATSHCVLDIGALTITGGQPIAGQTCLTPADYDGALTWRDCAVIGGAGLGASGLGHHGLGG